MPTIEPIDAVALRQRIDAEQWPDVMVLDEVGSTNAALTELAREGAAAGTVVATGNQTAGRARHTRAWTTPPGTSLSVSMLLRPEVPIARWTWLPLLSGVAIAEAIRAVGSEHGTGLPVELKWPNDVLLEGAKVCGILAEQVPSTSGGAVVVGCGINVSMDRAELPVPTATSLLLAGAQVSMTDLLVAVLDSFAATLAQWQQDPDSLREVYERSCGTIGRRVRVQTSFDDQDPAAFVTGQATGVDEFGRLLVDDGREDLAFSAGDVVHLR